MKQLIAILIFLSSSLFAVETGPANTVLRVPNAGGRAIFGALDLSQSVAVTGLLPAVNGGVPVGSIMSFAGTSAPTGWFFCDGTAISRSTYAALFAVIGTQWGYGDNSTTFNRPDLRGFFLRGTNPGSTATGSGTASSNNATFTAHGFTHNGIRVRLTSGTLSGLTTNTDYFVIVVDANTLAFASNLLAATGSVSKIAISGSNSAVITYYNDPDQSTRYPGALGGSTGAGMVGLVQEDDFKSHTHIPQDVFVANANGAGSQGKDAATSPASNKAVNVTTATGGNESRPRNISVNYIIKY